jgi:hypothetical protein
MSNGIPSEQQIRTRLEKLLVANAQGPEAFHQAFEEIFPVKAASEAPKSSNADFPEFWRDGEPMPDWAKDPRTPEA